MSNVDKSICPVHKYKMEKKDVSILYGMPIGPVIGYSEAKDLYFPNCDDILIGGCVVEEGQKSKKLKFICNQCNQERAKWKKLHRSEIIFNTDINIKLNLEITLNYEITINKTHIVDNHFVNCISLPNGIRRYFYIGKLSPPHQPPPPVRHQNPALRQK